MGLFKSILKSKAVEDGIEKVIQYGKKTLTVMKPEVSEWAVLNGGTTVPKSMIEYYEKHFDNRCGRFFGKKPDRKTR